MRSLPANYHVRRWLAHASCNLALQRWGRPIEQPANAASRLSLANSRQKVKSCETASRKGRLKGLSRMMGNYQVRFLEGLGAAMPPGYPAPNSPFGTTRFVLGLLGDWQY